MTRVTVGKKKSTKPTSPETKAKLLHYAALEIGRLVLDGEYALVERTNPSAEPIALPHDATNTDAIIDAVLAVAKQEGEKLAALHHAVRANNSRAVMQAARAMVNLPKEASHGAEGMH